MVEVSQVAAVSRVVLREVAWAVAASAVVVVADSVVEEPVRVSGDNRGVVFEVTRHKGPRASGHLDRIMVTPDPGHSVAAIDLSEAREAPPALVLVDLIPATGFEIDQITRSTG